MAFGLTAQGFQPKQLQDIKAEIQASLNAAFGQNLDFQPTTVFGQIVGIMSEQLAEEWQVLEAIYASQYPSGAEGTSVDNILALNNLRRLGATASKTAPTDTSGTPGLVVYGTPGTIVTAGSLISVPTNPDAQFSIDVTVTIGSAVNDVQTLFFSNVPDVGHFSLSIVDPAHVTQTTANILFTANAAAVQAAINALPGYSGVTVTGSFTTGFIITFAGSSGNQYQNPFTVASNTLQQGVNVTNINVVHTTQGHPAQAIASATCVNTGPIPASANSLTQIDTPISGWASVNNPLDALVGTNEENDTEALQRRDRLLAEQANGPIQSIVEKVLEVPGVTQALGFENRTEAAVQNIIFGSVPVVGNFRIQFQVGIVTALIPFTADSSVVQAAINALTGFSMVLVTGNFSTGFSIDFNGYGGGQPQDLVTIPFNSLGVSATPEFGRPPKSFEIVAQGGDDTAIAEAIYGAKPAGIETYGNTTIDITDAFGNIYPISFSRPTQVPIYVSIVLVTDLSTTNPKFNVGSIPTIQQDIVDIGNAVPIGGLIIGFGSDGLIGAFNAVPGILSYTLAFGESPGPVSNTNIQLQPEQIAEFETFLVSVSFT